MRFFGWVFLIVGILNVLFMPIFALFLIIIGILLISFGRKGKDRRDVKKAKKLRYKAAMVRKGGDEELADYYEIKAKKYE